LSIDPPAAGPLAQPLAWDLVADAYAEEIVPLFEFFAERALALADVGPRSRVLDVAAGPGTLSLLAAERAAEVIAVDFSPEMIAHLSRRIVGRGLRNIRAILGDGQALDPAYRGFDAAFSLFGVIFFPDPNRGLAELFRVLVPGGRVVVSSWPPLDRNRLMTAAFAGLAATRPDLALPPPGRGPLGDPEGLASALRLAGFDEVAVHEATVTRDFATTAEAWAAIARTTAPLVLLRRSVGEDSWHEVAGGVEAELQLRLGRGPVRYEAPAYLGIGCRPRGA
jgi:SAM-dependent methyltransferase